jgi:Aerotolerance regulator N-terminal/von Willebrand factor type A domain
VSFLNPLFLFGLAAASLPIIIHLFTRRQPREVRFPSLEFLEEVNQSEIRRVRIKQWLLLLLRTLAVAAIALAMARPALRGAAGGTSSAGTTVVALVDRSGSMGAAGTSGTLAAQARRIVEDLLTTLGPADELLLVPYDRAPAPVTPRPSSDLGRMRASVQGLAATARTTDHRAALETAARALGESRSLNRELFWISDFQASGFTHDGVTTAPAAPAGPWAQARVYLMPLAPRSRANAALTDASLAPTENGVALSVSAASFGARAGDLAVEVLDARSRQPLGRGFVSLPAQGEGATLLPLSRLPEEGGEAVLPDDPLPLDNHRTFAAGKSGTLRVLLREDGAPSALRLALEAGSPASGLAVEAVDGASLPARLRDADVLVLDDLERLGAAELQATLDFARAGGGLFVVLGERADPAFWNASVLGELGAGTLGAVEQAAPGAAWRLVRTAAGHPVLAGFPTRPGEALSTARFERIRPLRAGPAARVLLEFDRARPALVEVGHTLVFCGPLDPEASDFPVSGAFLPLVHQAVKVLGRGTAAASLTPGDRYRAPASTGTWRIEDPAGREVPSELVAAAGAMRLQSAPLEQPGLYRVIQDGVMRTTFAVNPDVRESDLTPAPEASLLRAFPPGRAQILRPGADLARRVREARYGRELWSWFVILALLLLIAESILARWGMMNHSPETAR